MNAKTNGILSYCSVTSNNLNLMPFTIRDCLNHICKNEPNRIVYIFNKSGRQLTYLDVKTNSYNLAYGLIKIGIKKYDRIAIISHNLEELIYIYIACGLIGCTIIPLDPDFSIYELDFMLKICDPNCIIFLDSLYNIIEALVPNINDKYTLKSDNYTKLTHLISIYNTNENKYWSFEDLLLNINNETEFEYVDPDSLFAILFTVIIRLI